MNKKTLSNIVFLLAVNVVVKPFWLFGIDRVVQNELGEETFGIYFALFNFSMIYQIILDFGIQNYNSKVIAEDSTQLSKNFPNLVITKIILGLIYFSIIMVSFVLLGYSFADYGELFLFLATNQLLISFIFYLRSNLAGLQKFKLDSFFSVLDKLIMIGLAGSMLYYNKLGISLNIFNFVLIQTIAFAINFILLFAVVMRLAVPLRWTFDVQLVNNLLVKSSPFALSIFLMAIYLRMDAIMIERLLIKDGAYEAGVYAQSFRIIDALNMIGILFANILLPTYAKRLADNLPIKKLILQSLLLLYIIIIPIAIFIIIKSKWIIHLMYDNGSNYSATILAILTVSFVAYSTMHIFSSMLTASSNLKVLNRIFFIGIVLNFSSNFILIPIYGAKGAAITTTCSEVLVLIAIMFATIRVINTRKQVLKS